MTASYLQGVSGRKCHGLCGEQGEAQWLIVFRRELTRLVSRPPSQKVLKLPLLRVGRKSGDEDGANGLDQASSIT